MIGGTFRRLGRFVCLIAVVLALAGQISAGAARNQAASVSRSEQAANALASAMVLCQGSDGRHSSPIHHRHRPDQANVAILAYAGEAVALPNAAALLPAPNVAAAAHATLYSARAPPGLRVAAFYPRGPPSPV